PQPFRQRYGRELDHAVQRVPFVATLHVNWIIVYRHWVPPEQKIGPGLYRWSLTRMSPNAPCSTCGSIIDWQGVICSLISYYKKSEGISAMHILHVVGARPNFMKAAPVFRAFAQQSGVPQTLVHTGQHYDVNM